MIKYRIQQNKLGTFKVQYRTIDAEAWTDCTEWVDYIGSKRRVTRDSLLEAKAYVEKQVNKDSRFLLENEWTTVEEF